MGCQGWWVVCASWAVVAACGPTVDATPPNADTSATSTAESTTAEEPPDTTTLSTSAVTSDGATSAESGSLGSSSTADATTGSSGSTCDPSAPILCSGEARECSDGDDNDLDGHVDLDDPECLGPCDEGERGFGEPNMHRLEDCRLDCAFDGNSGHGDDGCMRDLRCDPLEPLEQCAAQPGPCEEPPSDPECPAYCVPFTPDGCDCWGCCAIEVDGEPRNVLVTWTSDCSFESLAACPECTPRMDACGNPCDVEACEICFGQSEPPPGCAAAGCGDAQPCVDNCDCEPEQWCGQGCCRPVPPG